jgi:NAD dependent epimerase/dehydratase family enzyme
MSVPKFAIRLAAGEMADEMLLAGQKVLPRKLLDAGFEFEYREIEPALQALLG